MDYSKYNVPRGTIEKYVDLLLTWNKKINLISIQNEHDLINRHILDSLQLKEYIEESQKVFDIGSGAGFPGLMLSYAGIKEVNLIEKIGKKASFLTVAAGLSSNKVIVHNKGVEQITTNECDIITARGFAELNKVFELTNHLNKNQTKYFLLKGKNVHSEIKNALEKWSFKYIIHPSYTSEDGCVLEVEHLKKHEQKYYCRSESERRSW